MDRIKAAGVDVWLAWYTNATPENPDRSSLCSMWQYASDGKVDGVAEGNVDLDVSYKDYGAPKTAV